MHATRTCARTSSNTRLDAWTHCCLQPFSLSPLSLPCAGMHACHAHTCTCACLRSRVRAFTATRTHIRTHDARSSAASAAPFWPWPNTTPCWLHWLRFTVVSPVHLASALTPSSVTSGVRVGLGKLPRSLGLGNLSTCRATLHRYSRTTH